MKDELLTVIIFKTLNFVILLITFTFLTSQSIELGVIGIFGQLFMILSHHAFLASKKKTREVNMSFYLVTPLIAFMLSMFISEVLFKRIGILSLTAYAFVLGAVAEYTFEIIDKVKSVFVSMIPVLLSKLMGKKDE